MQKVYDHSKGINIQKSWAKIVWKSYLQSSHTFHSIDASTQEVAYLREVGLS